MMKYAGKLITAGQFVRFPSHSSFAYANKTGWRLVITSLLPAICAGIFLPEKTSD
jgi:hypothetical protein